MPERQSLLPHNDDHLPSWVTKRCSDCGELFLPGFGSVWRSWRPDEHTHGGLKYCKRQADYLSANSDALALQVILAEQACVEAAQTLGRFVAEADDENWNDEVADAVLSAMASAERGMDAHKLVAFKAEVAA